MRPSLSNSIVSLLALVAKLSCLLLPVLLCSFEASAADVFYSPGDDGLPAVGVPTLATAGPEWMSLYVDETALGATVAGTPCVDGDGGEICAVEFVVQAGAGAELVGFIPEPSVDHVLLAGELRALRVDAISPGIGPLRLGTLIVQTGDPATGGDVLLANAAVVGASFELEAIPGRTLATLPVPEPGLLGGLAAGVLLISCLVRRFDSRRRPPIVFFLSILLFAVFSTSPSVARQNSCDAEYPSGCAGTLFDPCLWEGTVSRDCGGLRQPVCTSGALCDAPYNPIGGICTNECGVSDTLTCANGCVAGVDEYDLGPIRTEVRAGTATQPGLDEIVSDIQDDIQAALDAAESQVRSAVPSSIPNPIEQDIEDEIIDCITEFTPAPSSLNNYPATANYCFDTNPVAFDAPPNIRWPSAEAPPAVRAVIGIHGRLSGGYLTSEEIAEIAGDLEPATEVRAYQVDYNAAGNTSQTMRVYERLADGTWNMNPVFEGPVSDGTNFTVPDVANFVRDFIVQLPEVGPIALIGASQGGFIVRDLIYRHYDALRLEGKEIVSATFLGHPHYGIVIDPRDYVWVLCSEVLTQTPEASGLTAQEKAQDCATARWMVGWDTAAEGLPLTTPYLDNRSHPQIDWRAIAGDAGGLGGVLDFPFWDRFTNVSRSTVIGDGTVPTASSLGVDAYGNFQVGDLQYDETETYAVGHDARPLRDGLAGDDPDWLRHRAVCGDVDGFEGLTPNDAAVLRLGLLDPSTLPPEFAALCSVEGDAGCNLLDAVRAERWAAQLEPRGLQSCAAAAPPSGGTTTFHSSRSDWLAALGTSDFDLQPTSAAAIEEAVQVASPPSANAQLCSNSSGAIIPCALRFEKATTGLCRDFELRTSQGVTFDDSGEGGAGFQNALSIGDVNNGENDDFSISIVEAAGVPLHGLGVTVVGNGVEPGERLVVVGASGAILAVFDDTVLPPSANDAFYGVVSSEPIASLYFDENAGGDDMAIKDFVFERTVADLDADGFADCDDVPTVTFTTNLTSWSNGAGTIEVLATGTASNIALANEVATPPGANAQLCSAGGSYQVPCSLTWDKAISGFCRSFSLSVQQGITYNDNEFSSTGLSIGDVDNGENDDFAFDLGDPGDPPLYAFGFTLVDANSAPGESLSVFDTNGALIGEWLAIPENGDFFIGIQSNTPIGRIEFDEDEGGDDIAIRNFRFDCDGQP